MRSLFEHRKDFKIGKEFFRPAKIDATSYIEIRKDWKPTSSILGIPIIWGDLIKIFIEMRAFNIKDIVKKDYLREK